jgi:phospholipid/cholesterol/gamma-HCH transport system permease protein
MGLLGGYLAGDWLRMVNPDHFLMGYFDEFNPYFVVYALTKTVFFAFIISSISAWYGFHVKGGAVEVGKASTKAVVTMSFTIILFNYILTNVMLQ